MIKKTYYNIQLISSFLLDKTRFILILLLILLNGNSIFSLVLCDEATIDTIAENKNNQPSENESNSALYLAIGAVIGVCLAVIFIYYTSDTGSGGGSFSVFSNDTTSTKIQNVSLIDQIHGTSYMSNKLASVQASHASILKTHNQLRADYMVLDHHCEALQKNQIATYNFLGNMMIQHPETYEDISRFIDKHPQVRLKVKVN